MEKLINCICIYMQPIFNIETKIIEYVEILVRDTRGELSATEIIEEFVKHKQTLLLDKIILEKACMFMRLFKLEDCRVCVNICPETMQIPDSSLSLIHILNKFKIDKELFIFEINEEVDFDNKVVKGNINNLFRNKIHLAMDDFGVKNSSLLVFSDLDVKVNTVKLDRKFLLNMTEHKMIMLQSILNMLKSAHVDVIIEGVETIEQFELVKSIGYNRIQGFLLAKPMDIVEFTNKYSVNILEE